MEETILSKTMWENAGRDNFLRERLKEIINNLTWEEEQMLYNGQDFSLTKGNITKKHTVIEMLYGNVLCKESFLNITIFNKDKYEEYSLNLTHLNKDMVKSALERFKNGEDAKSVELTLMHFKIIKLDQHNMPVYYAEYRSYLSPLQSGEVFAYGGDTKIQSNHNGNNQSLSYTSTHKYTSVKSVLSAIESNTQKPVGV